MIKLIEADSIQQLENFSRVWLADNTTDKREIEVISSQVIPINEVRGVGLNGQPNVKTTFCNWMTYRFVYPV
jgi:hypothetical protein